MSSRSSEENDPSRGRMPTSKLIIPTTQPHIRPSSSSPSDYHHQLQLQHYPPHPHHQSPQAQAIHPNTPSSASSNLIIAHPNPPALSLSTSIPPSSHNGSNNPLPDPSLSLPITPEALLKHVRQMKIAARNRKRSPSLSSRDLIAPSSLSVHSRAGSNASSTFDDGTISNLCLSSSTLSTGSNEGHSTLNDHSTSNLPQPSSQPHPSNPTSLTIPESQPRLDPARTMAETLDLSHRRIADLTRPVVEELAEYVERLALGYNYLPVLPNHFALLGESLRYLNLRGNHMEIFPEVLTRMPSLEILDVSRNKIKAFPRRPGSLDRLRVLSVSRNRIKRLPNYVANLSTLRVLKIDHNPVVWPPKELVTFIDTSEKLEDEEVDHPNRTRDESLIHTRTRTPSNETSTTMVQWLRCLQDWMRKNPYVRPAKHTRPSTTETSVDPYDFLPTRPSELERSFNNFKAPNSPDSSPAMTFNSGVQTPSPITNTSIQPSRPLKTHEYIVQHNRNASSSSSSQWVRKRPELRLKKSLPDLRRNHAEIMVERSADVERPYFPLNLSSQALPPNSSCSVTFSLQSPSIPECGPRSAMALSGGTSIGPLSSGPINYSSSSRSIPKTPDLIRSGGSQIRRIKIGASVDDDALAGDRNSGAYFRRLSMLPASTISKQVPTPLLQLIDGIRGILFSLSQIYAALKQFVIFATQDRLPGALSRVTSAADDSMGKLINSLDRFDSSTRRSQPEMEVVQQVFKACRDNVIVFGKLVNVLSIQLKVLTGSADVRYSRTLLLSLYGAKAEIAMSWQMITPLVDDVISLPSLMKPMPPLQESKVESLPSTDFHREPIIASTSELHRTPSRDNLHIDQAKLSESIHHATGKAITNPSGSSTPFKARRHAGPFLTDDMQPSSVVLPTSAGLVNHLPPTPSLPTGPYSLSSTSTHDSNVSSSTSGMKLESLNVTLFNDGPRHRNLLNRSHNAGSDSFSLGLPLLSMNDAMKLNCVNDSSPTVVSPVSLPRSPAFTSIASLATGSTMTNDSALATYTDLNTTAESQNERSLLTQQSNHWVTRSDSNSRPTQTWTRTLVSPPSNNMVEIPERTTSRHHHARFDSSLARTDQDFLDMAEATIEIALSVTSMMLENLGQATLETSTAPTHTTIPNIPSEIETSSSTSNHHRSESGTRRERKGTMDAPSTSYGNSYSNHHHHQQHHQHHHQHHSHHRLTKAGELKELCEVEIEVIRRLRNSLSKFWTSRRSSISTPSTYRHPQPQLHYEQHQPRDGSSSSTSTSASITSTSTTPTTVDLASSSSTQPGAGTSPSPNPSPSYSSSFSSLSTSVTPLTTIASSPLLPSSNSAVATPIDHYDDNVISGSIHGPEAKRVFEDATAFVRAVILTANLARATMTEYPLSKAIREGLGELTKATKELATLLAVSSFKPGQTSQHPQPSSSQQPQQHIGNNSNQLISPSIIPLNASAPTSMIYSGMINLPPHNHHHPSQHHQSSSSSSSSGSSSSHHHQAHWNNNNSINSNVNLSAGSSLSTNSTQNGISPSSLVNANTNLSSNLIATSITPISTNPTSATTTIS